VALGPVVVRIVGGLNRPRNGFINSVVNDIGQLYGLVYLGCSVVVFWWFPVCFSLLVISGSYGAIVYRISKMIYNSIRFVVRSIHAVGDSGRITERRRELPSG
jgi:hypothetical protein